MAYEFLGKGWRFPVSLKNPAAEEPPANGEENPIAEAHHEECVHQAIRMILGTAPGERVMRPDFGCGVHDLIFAPNSPGTAGRVIGEVRRALVRWEPRMDVLSVDAYPDATSPNVLLIEIHYQVRATSNRFNLVYPFYLE